MNDERDDKTEAFDLQRYLGIVRRRHLHFMIPLFFGWVVVWASSWVLSPRYQSSTLILVEQPTMPKDYVTPNINDDLQQRMQSITQQILSRTNLLHIIDQFHLYTREHGEAMPDDKVASMRKDIEIELVRDGARNQITAFNVSYKSRDPRVAQVVTGELTNLFINQNLEVRQRQSEDTTHFLENQLEGARQDLTAQEEKIRQFKAQHVGEMPGQLNSNLQILQGLQSQLQSAADALNSARQQKVYLQSLSDQYRTLQGPVKTSEDPMGLSALDDQLQKLHTQLTDLSARYTSKHPDVRKLKEEIATTEKLREQLLANLSILSSKPAPAGAQNPVMEATKATMLAPIESQLQSNQLEINNREQAIAGLKLKIEEYQSRLNQEPIREQQLADLSRGYDQSKANYDALLKKKNESSIDRKSTRLNS